jgi:hypothetical protein
VGLARVVDLDEAVPGVVLVEVRAVVDEVAVGVGEVAGPGQLARLVALRAPADGVEGTLVGVGGVGIEVRGEVTLREGRDGSLGGLDLDAVADVGGGE